jgi:phage regulator Rha-like protein
MHQANSKPNANLVNDHTPNLPSVSTPIVELSSGDDGEPLADSREVAKKLKRRHDHVLQAIRGLDLSNDFKARNFRDFKINDLTKPTGESTSHVFMTEPGFMALCRSLKGSVTDPLTLLKVAHTYTP